MSLGFKRLNTVTEQLTQLLKRAVCDCLTMLFIILGTNALLQS